MFFISLIFTDALAVSFHSGNNMTINITFGGLDPRSCPMSVGKMYPKELQIKPGEWKDVVFDCSTPEKYWNLVIVRKIGKWRGFLRCKVWA